VRSADVFEDLSARHQNSLYLPGHTLSEAIRPTRSLEEAAAGAAVAVLAVPSHALREVAGRLAEHLEPSVLAVSAAKGLEQEGKRMTEVLAAVLPAGTICAALSGPSFAQEVARGLPTAITLACAELASARRLQRLFATPLLRVYASQDVAGVELGGATKNVIAIAAGVADGLGFGHNTRAALITRGLAEMARLGARLGALPATFAGLAGLGDLVLTCTGDLSRNRSLGLGLGRGRKLSELTAGSRQVAEGVRTAASLRGLAQRCGVEMPICEQVWRVLYEGKEPRQAVHELMTRDLKDEGV
jgi:glycerol-3-phosphate dehydrogenase (NAD(P)+)